MLAPTCLLALVALVGISGDELLTVSEPPLADEFVVVPLRLHVLASDELPELDCKLTDEDLIRILGKVNRIWRPAGIYWGLESIVRETVVRQERFTVARDLAPSGMSALQLYRMLLPDETRAEDAIDVYYLHKFSVNGVHLGGRIAIVQETARLREVPGGIDEPIPRVTAHELGHALGLLHRQDRTNLLASGTTGTTLNMAEIETAREHATQTPGALSLSELQTSVETETDDVRGAVLSGWLREILSGVADASPVILRQNSDRSEPCRE